MKQVLQCLKTGKTRVEDVPCPQNTSNTLLIETTKTLVSAGTERMLLEFGKANILGKIKQQPDKVKMILEKIKTDGLISTLGAVQAKLDQPIALGYCQVGHVIEVGEKITGFSIGDRVVSNAYHAEIARATKNTCAKIPDNIGDEEAVFTVVGAIALQGIRLSKPMLGECYIVFGLGLIGLLAVQLLKANGCRVLGIDFDAHKCALAKQFGADIINASEDMISTANLFSRGHGVDAVIITASTKSNALLHQAASICRKRGRIVLIGVIGNELSRADFYEKELSFQVSCSYGPGRYDDNYEKKGLDYPIGFVRFTMQRNFESVLDMMSSGQLNVKPLISKHVDIDHVYQAYDELDNNKSVLGIVIDYPERDKTDKTNTTITVNNKNRSRLKKGVIGFLGAGNYGATVLAPAFEHTGVRLETVVSSQGLSAKQLAKKCKFKEASSDESSVFLNENINMVVVATRHNLHADQIIRALQNNKHVFVEKPLALTLNDLEKINTAYQQNKNNIIMIGFNRRFSPMIQTIKRLLQTDHSPKSFVMTINAGSLAKKHWAQDRDLGGGRIVGEACHFIDLLRYLAEKPIKSWHAVCMKTGCDVLDDNTIITLTFDDGSIGTIQYLANGHKKISKERLEIFCNGKILQLDNFRRLTGFGWKTFKKEKSLRQNKGQIECVQAFVDAVSQGMPSPIAFNEIMEVSRLSIEIAEHIRC